MLSKKLPGLLLIVALWLVAPSTQAASKTTAINFKPLTQRNINYNLNQTTGLARYLNGDRQPLTLSKQVTGSANLGKQFLLDYGQYFGADKDGKNLKQDNPQSDSHGFTHLRYQQQINGVPIFGSNLLVHLQGNQVKSASGNLTPTFTIDTKAKLTVAKAKSQAVSQAKSLFNSDHVIINDEPTLYIFNKNSLAKKYQDKNILVYEVNVYDQTSHRLKTLFINAATGALVHTLDGSPTDGTLNRKIYNCNGADASCYLNNAPTGFDNGRSEGQRAIGDGQVDGLYSLLSDTHAYFRDTFNLNGANNQGGIDGNNAAKIYTNGYANYDFPTGDDYTCPNSFWNGVNSLFFCDKTVNTAIVGHEYGHAVVKFQGPNNFPYEGETGAINEAYADIFGQGLVAYTNGAPDWKIGPTGGGTWRDIATPANTSDPETTYSSDFYCGDWDNGGVHQDSVPISHSAYLLTVGGTVGACDVQAIGFDKVQQIFYLALDKYLPNNATFNNLYDSLIDACRELYPSGDTCFNVTKALRVAKLDQAGACGGVAEAEPKCEPIDARIITQPIIIDTPKPVIKLEIKPQPIIINPTPTVDLPDNIDLTPDINVPPITAPQPDTTVKTPDIDIKPTPIDTTPKLPIDKDPKVKITVTQKNNLVTVSGEIIYWGTADKCTGPRPAVSGAPIIIRSYGGHIEYPAVDNKFYAQFIYGKPYGKDQELSVSVTNSCYQSDNQHFPISTNYTGAGDSVQTTPSVQGEKITNPESATGLIKQIEALFLKLKQRL